MLGKGKENWERNTCLFNVDKRAWERYRSATRILMGKCD